MGFQFCKTQSLTSFDSRETNIFLAKLILVLFQVLMDETDDENFDSFFRDAPWQEFECDISQDCPPPLFDLPPPPRPPWLQDDSDSCDSVSPYESCENIVIIDSGVRLEETFQNLIIIAVCSAILVILLVFTVACIWR